MAMKYTKVLKYMQEHGGRVSVDDPALKELLGDYKLVGAMSAIRRLAKLDVRVIRNKRKAIAYELVAITPAQPRPAILDPENYPADKALTDAAVFGELADVLGVDVNEIEVVGDPEPSDDDSE